MKPDQQWRKSVLREIRIGRALERIARQLELPGAECRPHFEPPAIDVSNVGGDLAWFSDNVKLVATRLGSAERVEAQNWVGTGNRAPDLVAEWILDGETIEGMSVRVLVRCLLPTGCKVDPRTEYLPESKLALHPECAAVLRELEDV